MLKIKLNDKLQTQEYIEFANNVKENEPWSHDNDEYITTPFSVGVIRNFIDLNDDDYNLILKQFESLDLIQKNNDLYKFHQSSDFRGLSNSKPIISDLRNFFLIHVLPFMKRITGIDLYDNEIDITFSRYGDSDYLLCHDDHLEERRVAFVWYLVDKSWCSDKYGGQLDLINTNSNGEPMNVCKSINPEHNSFVFFKVAQNSFHQVREVQLDNKMSRISINGWFRGPGIIWDEAPIIPAPRKLTPGEIDEELLYSWVNNLYLQEEVAKDIRKDFVENSEIQIEQFINEDQLELLSKALNNMPFKLTGIMTHRQVFLPDQSEESYPDPVRQFIRLLQSDAIMLILSMMTNLQLDRHFKIQDEEKEDEEQVEEGQEPPVKKMKPSTSDGSGDDNHDIKSGTNSGVEIRNWRNGCYTLLRDGDMRQKETRLELFFHLGPYCDQEHYEDGGYWSYYAEGDSEELLNIHPADNALSLILADHETMGFMKYIGHRYQTVYEIDSEDGGTSEKMGLFEIFSSYFESE